MAETYSKSNHHVVARVTTGASLDLNLSFLSRWINTAGQNQTSILFSPQVSCTLASGLGFVLPTLCQAGLFGLGRLETHPQGDLPSRGHVHHRPKTVVAVEVAVQCRWQCKHSAARRGSVYKRQHRAQSAVRIPCNACMPVHHLLDLGGGEGGREGEKCKGESRNMGAV